MKHALSLPALVLAAVLAACQASPPPTPAEIEAVAMHARQAGDQQAERKVRNWAGKDMPVAERELALIYQPRPERRAEALSLFEQAARAGDTEAAFELGQMRRAATPGQAWLWYRQAALQGHAKAALMLGLLAANGSARSWSFVKTATAGPVILRSAPGHLTLAQGSGIANVAAEGGLDASGFAKYRIDLSK